MHRPRFALERVGIGVHAHRAGGAVPHVDARRLRERGGPSRVHREAPEAELRERPRVVRLDVRPEDAGRRARRLGAGVSSLDEPHAGAPLCQRERASAPDRAPTDDHDILHRGRPPAESKRAKGKACDARWGLGPLAAPSREEACEARGVWGRLRPHREKSVRSTLGFGAACGPIERKGVRSAARYSEASSSAASSFAAALPAGASFFPLPAPTGTAARSPLPTACGCP